MHVLYVVRVLGLSRRVAVFVFVFGNCATLSLVVLHVMLVLALVLV